MLLSPGGSSHYIENGWTKLTLQLNKATISDTQALIWVLGKT